MTTHHDVTAFDCGDGVPNLRRITSEEATIARIDNPRISAGTVAMILTVSGQLAILLAVLAGGSAVVGALAALGLLACGLALIVGAQFRLACGLTLLGAKSIRALVEDDRPAENPFDGPSRLSNGASLR